MLQLKVHKKIGKEIYEFTVSGENLHDVIMQREKLSFRNVDKCGICGSEYLVLSAYITKEDKYEYAKVLCLKCKASVTFGKKKQEPDVYFLRRNDLGELDWQVAPIKTEAQQPMPQSMPRTTYNPEADMETPF
jgi:hypothetical protein